MVLSDGIGNIQGLIGALAVAAFSFILPWIIYFILFKEESATWFKVVTLFFFATGLIAALVGAVASAKSMGQMSAGLFKFDQADCQQNAFFMGEFGGSDIVNPKHQGAFSHDQGEGSFYATFYNWTCGIDGSHPVRFECAQPEGCCIWDHAKQKVVCCQNPDRGCP